MSIAELQLLNLVLNTKDYSVIVDNNVTEEYFSSNKEEFLFIDDFYRKYNCVPDKETFSSKFINHDYFKVSQSYKAILDNLREELLFRRAVILMNESSKRFEKDSRDGASFLLANIDRLRLNENFNSINIMQDTSRLDEWKDKLNNPEKSFIDLPFKEMKDSLYGFMRGEELFIFLSRSGVGKTHVMALCAESASRQGYKVGVISPELAASTFGYRVDSARSHLSNSAMTRGLLLNGYEAYISELVKKEEHIYVADSDDFYNGLTISDCETFIRAKNLDILIIDDISYIDLPKSGSLTVTEKLGKICRSLFNMSKKYEIPIVVTTQARRRKDNSQEEDILNSESVFNSYYVTQQATRIVSINKFGDGVKLFVAKNRYGQTGDEFVYTVDFDKMRFTFIPSKEDAEKDEGLAEVKNSLKFAI